jgi:peptide subunit release factor 1 (eRF1)
MNDEKLIERLQALQSDSQPCVSLYLNTQAEREQGPNELNLRWRAFREEVAGKVPEKALLLLDDVVEGAHRKGDGLMAFTSGEELKLRLFLNHPVPDCIAGGPLPHLVPLFEWKQDQPTYAVVVTDRQGADIHVMDGSRGEEVTQVEGGHDELRKVSPGGWSQRRYQNRAEDSWERNAEQVAKTVDRIVQDDQVELVLVTGDVRAVAYLKENVTPAVAPKIHELDAAPPTDEDLKQIRDDVERNVSALTARITEASLGKFLEERGQSDLACEGLSDTISALRMAQVDTLFVAPDGPSEDVWFSSSEQTQASVNRSALTEIGMNDVQQAPAVDVLVRQAIATGAAVRVIPKLGEKHGPRDGVGATLRYRADAGS